jgi:hypothetical protein
MAHIETDHVEHSESFTVRINGTESRKAFAFVCHPPHIHVSQIDQAGQTVSGDEAVDWFDALSKPEKLSVFREISDHYIQFSHAAVKTAAIGMVRNPNPQAPNNQKHFLFLGINTERRGSDYFKDCAEQNMVNAATISMAQRLGEDAYSLNTIPMQLEAIAISGYRPADANNPAITATCPCGKCTDMLAKVMKATGEVYVLPHLPPRVEPTINQSAITISGVNKTEIWDTTISGLNRNRCVTLNETDAALQRDGQEHTVSNASRLSVKQHVEIDDVTQRWLDKASEKAKENLLSGRVSVPELDAAYDKDGEADNSLINRFMQRKIESTLVNRLVGQRFQGDLPKAKEFLESPKFSHIRCVVLRMDDGTMHYGMESDTPADNAAPNAEVSALTRALEGTGTHGVREIWAMELNPPKTNVGIMQTSPKEGLERLLKRRSRELPIDKITFHFMPINDGNLSKEAVDELCNRHSYTAETLYPGLFTGGSNKAAKIVASRIQKSDLPAL